MSTPSRTTRGKTTQDQTETMHTITIHACAQAFGVTPTQVYLWAERGQMNTKRGHDGSTRIHVDARYRRFKKTWLAPEEAEDDGAVAESGDGMAVSRPSIDEDALGDTHFLVADVAKMAGLSKSSIYVMTYQGRLTSTWADVPKTATSFAKDGAAYRGRKRKVILYDRKLHQLLQEHQ